MDFKIQALKSIKSLCYSLVLISLFSSCVSYKNIPYFQDLNKTQVTTENINNYSPNVIQPQDELLIHVTSADPETAKNFSNTLTANYNQTVPVYDYLVDRAGDVKLPIIGFVKASGVTADELADKLTQQLTTYLKQPKVTVRIINFKVAVLGDVARPNVYNSSSERLTIMDALSLAGDLNVTAKRDEIILVREKDGKREFIPMDLTSKKIFESPYFYLKSNDVVFVQPGKLKVSSIDNAGYRNASLIISALSVIATFSYLIFHK